MMSLAGQLAGSVISIDSFSGNNYIQLVHNQNNPDHFTVTNYFY